MADPATKTIPIDPAVSFGGVDYSSLSLREPTAGQLAETDDLDGYVSDIKLVSVVAAIPEGAVKLLPARPFLEATRYLGGFIRAAPASVVVA